MPIFFGYTDKGIKILGLMKINGYKFFEYEYSVHL